MTFSTRYTMPPLATERCFDLALRQHVAADDSVLHGVYPGQYQRHIYLRDSYISAALDARKEQATLAERAVRNG